MATLTLPEIKEAIMEWLKARGIPVIDPENIVIITRHLKGPQATIPDSDNTNYDFNAQVREIQLKEGPYR